MIDRRIKFRHIQSFVEIVRQRSLKRAAETLFVTQPAISKTLKELEDILGTPVLTRSRAGIALTRQGEVFLHFAERSLVTLQQGFDEIEQLGRGGGTAFTVGALPSVAARLMPQVTHEFFERAPEVTLRIIDGPHGYLIDLLRRGQIDVVIGRLGQSIMLPAINVSALKALPPEQLNNGSGSINFVRLMGGAFGVNTLVVFMEQRTEFHAISLTATQTAGNASSRELLDMVSSLLHGGGVPDAVLQPGALHYLGRVVEAQAQTMGFQDGFMVIAVVFILALIPAMMLGGEKGRR